MKVKEICEKLNLTVFNLGDENMESSDCYAGDLLSWVMGRAPVDSMWVTIMSNQNVAAVAVMADVSGVILCEDVKPDDALLEKAKIQGINLLGTKTSCFETCVALGKLFEK